MAADGRWTALVLAAGRGPDDPLARHTGSLHKALVPLGGTPMIVRVVTCLRSSPAIGRILVSIERDDVLAGVPELAAAGAVATPSGSSASASVLAVIDTVAPWPLLVVTADHGLLTRAMVERFLVGVPPDADVAAAVVPAEVVQRAYPAARRTFLRFRDRALKGANMFAFQTPASRGAALFWTRLEAHRKRPLRLIAELGPVAALGYALGWLRLDDAVRRLERKARVKAALVEVPIAEAAIDVDKPDDLVLAERILAHREAIV